MKVRQLLISLAIMSLLVGQSYDPNTGSLQNDPCIQAAIDAQNDVNGALWYGAGCLFGIFGVGASYVVEPNPNAFKLAGKTSDYASIYTGCYRLEAKKVQQQKARNGCLTYAAVYLLLLTMVSGG